MEKCLSSCLSYCLFVTFPHQKHLPLLCCSHHIWQLIKKKSKTSVNFPPGKQHLSPQVTAGQGSLLAKGNYVMSFRAGNETETVCWEKMFTFIGGNTIKKNRDLNVMMSTFKSLTVPQRRHVVWTNRLELLSSVWTNKGSVEASFSCSLTAESLCEKGYGNSN